jgi:hypothetical protein
VACGGVVLCVGDAPGVVRDAESVEMEVYDEKMHRIDEAIFTYAEWRTQPTVLLMAFDSEKD